MVGAGARRRTPSSVVVAIPVASTNLVRKNNRKDEKETYIWPERRQRRLSGFSHLLPVIVIVSCSAVPFHVRDAGGYGNGGCCRVTWQHGCK